MVWHREARGLEKNEPQGVQNEALAGVEVLGDNREVSGVMAESLRVHRVARQRHHPQDDVKRQNQG
jgi:hypothetical protein